VSVRQILNELIQLQAGIRAGWESEIFKIEVCQRKAPMVARCPRMRLCAGDAPEAVAKSKGARHATETRERNSSRTLRPGSKSSVSDSSTYSLARLDLRNGWVA